MVGFGNWLDGAQVPEVPFAAGCIYGLRAWDITDEGYLQSVSYAYNWTPGENPALCMVSHEYRRHLDALLFGATNVPPHILEWAKTHVAHKHCTCGFYGYWENDPLNGYLYTKRDSGVIGLIKAHGRVSYGRQGFRAAKAEIVALVDPYAEHQDLARMVAEPVQQSWKAKHRFHLLGGYAAMILIGFVLAFFTVWGSVVTFCSIPLGLWALSGVRDQTRWERYERAQEALGRITQRMTTLHQYRIERVKKRYPGIKWYRSIEEMVAAHPLTQYTELPAPVNSLGRPTVDGWD